MEGNESFVRRKWGEGWKTSERLYEENGVADGRKWECLYEGNGVFVWCCLRKVYRLSENTLKTFSENSIDFLEKLYRLSSDTL